MESTCWEAERQVEVASRILAGQVSPNSLVAVAAEDGALPHPLSPCHSDLMQPAAAHMGVHPAAVGLVACRPHCPRPAYMPAPWVAASTTV